VSARYWALKRDRSASRSVASRRTVHTDVGPSALAIPQTPIARQLPGAWPTRGVPHLRRVIQLITAQICAQHGIQSSFGLFSSSTSTTAQRAPWTQVCRTAGSHGFRRDRRADAAASSLSSLWEFQPVAPAYRCRPCTAEASVRERGRILCHPQWLAEHYRHGHPDPPFNILPLTSLLAVTARNS
jgi:hypothetical protein